MKTSPHCRIHAAIFSLAILAVSGPLFAADETGETDPTPANQPQQEEVADRLISLVILLEEPRKLDHHAIADAVEKGAGTKIAEADVQSKPPYHLVKVTGGKYLINDVAESYFEDPEKVAKEIDDPKLAEAIRHGKAWVSVDWVEDDGKADLHHVYQHLGKIAAALAGHHALAVYCPDLDQVRLYSPAVGEALTSDDPLQIFGVASEKPKGNQ